jgi:5-methylcytosine-specific restriction endonuclease McrA
MKKTKQRLRQIYDRTSGYCHLCRKKLSFDNYNCIGSRGAWHIDHSKPLSRGGTDGIGNLYAACVDCNNEKSNRTTRTARAWNGHSRAPMSLSKRKRVKDRNALIGAATGFAIGALFGPWGRIICTIAGAHVGSKANPD